MADVMTQKMSEASASGADVHVNPPKKGDKFRCQECGMEIEVAVACRCKAGEHVQFRCCGKELAKV
jgi:predicted RNA-binding Zn-ribbon protein involved in translation (DUF1610 family)